MESSCPDLISTAWFAVQVWTGREPLSAKHLRVRGYDVFLPCYREHRTWSDRVKKVDRALFAGVRLLPHAERRRRQDCHRAWCDPHRR